MNAQLNNQQLQEATATPNEVVNSGSLNRRLFENNLAVLTLYDTGVIIACNKAGAELLGCVANNRLTWQHISRFLPQLGDIPLLKGERINPYLRFLSRVGHHFEVIGMSGVHFVSELFFNEAENLGEHCLRIIIQPVRGGRILLS